MSFKFFWLAINVSTPLCDTCKYCNTAWWCPLVQCCIWSVYGPCAVICYLFALPMAIIGFVFDIILFLWYVRHRTARFESRKVDAGSLSH